MFEETANRFFSAPCKFIMGTKDYDLFPQENLAEFAFIGRSNVGKSSLINALVKQKGLARVSVTPGRTQQINFFDLGEILRLVDLPGYGYAKAPINLVKSWERMTLGYLKNRRNLRKLFLLIDSRHGFKQNDLDFMEKLSKLIIPYQIILTKADKTNKQELEKILTFFQNIAHNYVTMLPNLIISSGKHGHGINDLRVNILSDLRLL